MINLFSAVIQTEHAVWQLHGVSKEELLAWDFLQDIDSESAKAIETYLRAVIWGKAAFIAGTSSLIGNFSLRLMCSAYRPESNFDEFMQTFKPIGSMSKEGDIGVGVSENGENMVYFGLETYGKDLELVKQYAAKGCVATVIDNDRGGHSLIGGMHFVNRIYYLITEVPVPEWICIDMEAEYDHPVCESAFRRSTEYAMGQVFTQCDLPWKDLMDVLHDANHYGGVECISDIEDLEDVSVWEMFEDESVGGLISLLEDFQQSSYNLLLGFSKEQGIAVSVN